MVAVKCYNSGGPGFLAVSVGIATEERGIDLPVVSDKTWKCSSTHVSNWHKVAFDDSSWNTAYEIGSMGWETKPKKIWANKRHNAAGTSYCRRQVNLGK